MHLDGGDILSAPTIILACGVSWRRHEIEGFERLAGKGVSYLVDQLATRANIRVRFGTEVTAAHGDTSLEAIEVRDAATGETARVESGGLFVFIGADAETGWLTPRSHWIRRATCSPAQRFVPPGGGSSTAIRTSWRRASPASSRAATSDSVP
jgi:alkyl hydroperoxide reductase subunit AhpF